MHLLVAVLLVVLSSLAYSVIRVISQHWTVKEKENFVIKCLKQTLDSD